MAINFKPIIDPSSVKTPMEYVEKLIESIATSAYKDPNLLTHEYHQQVSHDAAKVFRMKLPNWYPQASPEEIEQALTRLETFLTR